MRPPQKDFKSHIREYFENRPYADVVFKFADKEILAHRSIVALRCPALADLFEKGKELILREF